MRIGLLSTAWAAPAPTLASLAGCAISTPFRGPGFDRDLGVVADGAGETLHVAVTRTEIAQHPGARSRFAGHLEATWTELRETHGLAGYSVRRQIFGRRAWTLSVWVDGPSLDAILTQPAHRAARLKGALDLEAVQTIRVQVAREELPSSWKRAERPMEAEAATP